MPILWRYILKNYFKAFLLCILSFICILLVMRTQEIARFAILNSSPYKVCLFSLYQLPYILPFAIPISALIATVILIQGLNYTYELTALRACGYSLTRIYAPLIFTASFLSIANFLVISEIGPTCKHRTSTLIYDSVSDNPLILLHKSKFIKIKDSLVDLQLSDNETHAKNLLFAFLDPSSKKLAIIGAEDLTLSSPTLEGNYLYTISSVSNLHGFDDLMIENHEHISMNSSLLASLLQKNTSSLQYDQLTTNLCLFKTSSSTSKKSGLFELYKRLFFTLIPITFVFLGICFSMTLGRRERSSSYRVVILTVLTFVCYLLGKALHKSPNLTLICYLLPHALIFILGLYLKSNFERGVES